MEKRHETDALSPPGRLHQPCHEEFTELYKTHSLAILRYVSRRVRPRERAEDVASRVFVTAFEKCDVILAIAEAERLPYLYAIARHHLQNELRAGDRSVRLLERIELDQAVKGSVEPDGTAIVDTQLELARAFNGLPEAYREVMSLVAFEELSVPEVAVVLGMSDVKVHGILSRARRLLRAEMSAGASKGRGHTLFRGRVRTS